MMTLFSLKSKSLDYLNLPFCESDDVAAINLIRNAFVQGSDPGLRANLIDLELVALGTFDQKEGLKKTKIRKVIDLDQIPMIEELRKEVLAHVQNSSESSSDGSQS